MPALQSESNLSDLGNARIAKDNLFAGTTEIGAIIYRGDGKWLGLAPSLFVPAPGTLAEGTYEYIPVLTRIVDRNGVDTWSMAYKPR